ncbi:MAG TPA: glycosyltransferase family 87 protein [Candidatus Limnocylindria bacterium]|nr:glycosyltransferase family 87 protein [Candidatus Limnocylindria bacterium]
MTRTPILGTLVAESQPRTGAVRPLRDIGIPGFIALIGPLVVFRLLGVYPWNEPAFDLHAYWITRAGVDYAHQHAGPAGTYLYSPAFAQAIRPLTLLPLPVFAAIWTSIGAALLIALTGRRALLVALLPPVLITLVQGQLDIAFAAVAFLGLRWPALWALPLLTKITPGVGLVWFLVRREWRSFMIALGVTLAVVAVSFVLDQGGWASWVAMLLRAEFPRDPQLVYLDIPLTVRLPIAVLLIAWGARTDRRWTIPVAMALAMPIVWANSVTILVALIPILAQEREAATERQPASVPITAR